MQETEEQKLVPIEEQISQELVKANVTETIIADLKNRYLPLKINGIEDKETYLLVKEARKECKSLRIMAEKICKKGREEAVAIQKAWVTKEKDVAGRIGEVEDHLEKQEKDYEAAVAKEKEESKRKQEEQYILRQQTLTSMGALYSDGSFILGEVSFELSLIKESKLDIWEETILPKFKEEYEKIKAEEIEKERIKAEQEAELKRQQEEMERKRKELEEKEAELKREEERQAKERDNKERAKLRERVGALMALGFKSDPELCAWVGYGIGVDDSAIKNHDDGRWSELIASITKKADEVKAAEAEEERKEQERKDLQNKRYAEIIPFKEYGDPIALDTLWSIAESEYSAILGAKKSAFGRFEAEKAQKIAEDAARKERERIEEEQRQAEIKRKQEEERKAEELAQASDKVKWTDLIEKLDAIEIHTFKSSQYRKKAAILREKLEEIKAL